MLDSFSRANDRLFARFGLDALYRSGAGDALSGCRVIPRQADELAGFGATQIRASGTVLEVRASEIATVAEGDSFIVYRPDGAQTVYSVEGAPSRDLERLVWACGVREC